MAKKIVAIPGIGDKKGLLELFFRPFTKKYGYELTTLTFDFTRHPSELDERIDSLTDQITSIPGQVHLYGASGGGAVSCILYSKLPEKIDKVVLFRAPVRNRYHASIYHKLAAMRKVPIAFNVLDECEKLIPMLSAEQKSRILTLAASHDWLVPPSKAYIEGANNHVFPMVGHLISATTGILQNERRIYEFLT